MYSAVASYRWLCRLGVPYLGLTPQALRCRLLSQTLSFSLPYLGITPQLSARFASLTSAKDISIHSECCPDLDN